MWSPSRGHCNVSLLRSSDEAIPLLTTPGSCMIRGSWNALNSAAVYGASGWHLSKRTKDPTQNALRRASRR